MTESLVKRAKDNASGEVWEETTSFLLFNCSKTAESLSSDIYVNSNMNGTYDRLLVVNLSSKDFSTRGAINDSPKLARLMSSR